MEFKRPSDNFFIRHATKIAVITITLLVLLAALLFWRQYESSKETRNLVEHTYEVIGHIQLMFGKLRDAQLGQRGYILTGDEEYLEPYHAALKEGTIVSGINSLQQKRSIYQELAHIRKMTADNPTQQSNLVEMEDTVEKLLIYFSESIENRKNNKNWQDLHLGKTHMDRMRSLVRIMESEESHLLSLRMETDEVNTAQSNRLIVISIILFYITMVFSILIYQRSRSRSVAQILSYIQELEKNEEELKMQQEELKASNEEIEAASEELEEKNKALEEQNAQIQQQSEELVESQKMIEEKINEVQLASKYKSEFLANMSHELRTPLNSLLILSKLLAANEEGNLTEEQVEEAQVIHNGGLELLNLINDILDLSKVEAGKLNIIAEDVALDSIVSRIRQQFMPMAKEKKLDFPIKIDPSLTPMLHTDAQRVEQILKNLLANAFKFTELGSVALEIRRPEKMEVQRLSLGDKDLVAFSVVDTGIGIEPSKLKDIFEAFQQEDGSIDRHYGGTGLGLTIARKFAHMLGGEINVRSEKGKGSSFTLILPVILEGVEMLAAPEPPPQSSRIKLKIAPKTFVEEFIADDRKNISDKDKVLLIIEDDKDFAAILMKISRKHGYKCICAGDGKTGLVLAMEQRADAVILDLTLPDIDGLQVLDQLKHDLRSRHIPVHIISGRDEENNTTLRKGAIGHLTKPVGKEEIDGVFTKIETLLQTEVKHVLVVEDDKKTQLAVKGLLNKRDIKLTMCATGEGGLAQLKSNRFDCVVLDLQLTDMTGLEWLEKLEKNMGDKVPPIVIYTARELSEHETRELERYTGSIIIKGAKSSERLLDEVTLFLHSVESSFSSDRQEMIRIQHNPDKALQGRTLLLVDDDLRNIFALSKLLRKHGMNIVIADNGQMALDKLAEDSSIELVIMDIMMPVMDGYQAIREIRSYKDLKSLPIIALTARAMPEEQEKCMAVGANDYLTKPVDIERLLTLLRVWLFRQEIAA